MMSTSLSLDESTRNKTLGRFTRILVDVDLSCCVFDEIMVERN
jgi:hypothetical protein